MAKMTSKGTRLQKSIASTFTTIAYVRSTNGPGPETQFFDGTDLNSEHLEDGEPTGQSAPGEVSGELFYDPANAQVQSMLDEIDDPATNGKSSWKIIWPNDDETAFTGTVRTVNPKASVGEALLADFTIKLSAMATFPS